MSNWTDTPFTRCSTAAFPLLVDAHGRLYGLAAPKASDLAHRIALLMEQVIDLSGEVEAYANKWCGGHMGQLGNKLREATAEYNAI